MKKFFFVLLNFFFVGLYAQNPQANAVIEYKLFQNTTESTYLDTALLVNGFNTIYVEKFSTLKNTDKPDTSSNSSIQDDYIKIDHKQKEIFSFEYLGANMVIVKDDYVNLNWHITEEAKKINGYNCLKATASYRGKNWIAWFTPEIALPYGPWKLYGLPGLIVEAHDSTDTFVWKIEKIQYQKDPIFNKDFYTLVKTKNKQPMSKKQYIHDLDEMEANEDTEHRIATPGMGETIIVTRGGYELKYEWEK